MTNITYYSDGNGRWLRREWKPQCPAKVLLSGRCQGVIGHKGVHWCYSPSGSFKWGDNVDDPRHDGCAGSTSPEDDTYVSPLEMQERYCMNHYRDSEVTDKTVIAMLEKDATPEDGASIDRPVRFDSARVYHRLSIRATHRDTEIWLGDDNGHFVQKATDELDTDLLPGNYTVEFGCGTAQYPIELAAAHKVTQAELECGPTCVRGVPEIGNG